jgi:hypothetical protein
VTVGAVVDPGARYAADGMTRAHLATCLLLRGKQASLVTDGRPGCGVCGA